jgi:4-aminobutyrate aminotransferase-like enzyme
MACLLVMHLLPDDGPTVVWARWQRASGIAADALALARRTVRRHRRTHVGRAWCSHGTAADALRAESLRRPGEVVEQQAARARAALAEPHAHAMTSLSTAGRSVGLERGSDTTRNHHPSAGYVVRVGRAAHDAGALWFHDETVTTYGRCGTGKGAAHLWIVPPLMITAADIDRVADVFDEVLRVIA